MELRVTSEEERRKLEKSRLDEELQHSQSRLEESKQQLIVAEEKAAAAASTGSAEVKHQMEVTVAKMKAAVEKAEAESRIRKAVEDERDRIEKEAQAIEKMRLESEASFSRDLAKVTSNDWPLFARLPWQVYLF